LKQAKRDGPPLGGAVVVPEGSHRRQDRALETLRWASRVPVGVGRGVLTALGGIFSLAESFLGMALPEAWRREEL
ncbi:hypothetical protein, partial [Ferrimicrobium acidiphilum]